MAAGGFSNPIVGGDGALVFPSIHSPNFVHGVSGWSINKDGSAEFQDVILPGTVGTTVTFAAVAPVSPAVGDVWYDTAAGLEANQWNGSAWVPYQIGTGAIAGGAITGSLVASGAITAAKLAAGIVYAGIVDSTTVNAATFTGSVFEGTDFILNSAGAFFYSGTPAAGNLVCSVIPGSSGGTDAHGNTYLEGLTGYSNQGGTWYAVSITYNTGTIGVLAFFTASSYSGSYSIQGSIGCDASGNLYIAAQHAVTVQGATPSFSFLAGISQMSNLGLVPTAYPTSGIGPITGTPSAAEYNALNTAYNETVGGLNTQAGQINTLINRLISQGYMA
jgi:hypothetical protein